MKLGIIGAGRIAVKMAQTIRKMKENGENVQNYAIASRNLDRAQEFARNNGFSKAYGSYQELVQDPEVDLIYIATPHSHHFEQMKLCLEHHKPVLCEKAFTVNAEQARQIAQLSRETNTLAAEAIWTRYMPSRKILNDLLANSPVGKITTINCNLSYTTYNQERIYKPELAGGALLDVGIYGLNFAMMHFGQDFERMESSVLITETGVDGQETITLHYSGNRMAVITSSIYSRSDRQGIFWGEGGYITVNNINDPLHIRVYDWDDRLIEEIHAPEELTGYEYEVRECMHCLEKGLIEPPSMPHSDTIFVMETMDRLRKSWGLKYPME